MSKYLAILFLSLLVACNQMDPESEEPVDQLPKTPDSESWNSEIYIDTDGRRAVVARADYLAQFNESNEIELIGHVKLDFFNEAGEHVSILHADTGLVHQNRKWLEARHNVVVVSDSGITLRTDQLMWHEARNRIQTDRPIMLTTELDTLYGVGFDSDANLENWTIRNPTGVTHREFSYD
ncbi:MAG: LPS export ABC transporter periplasmic protein LptC [Candidatus Marinimicrobia bacterium]|nr:LPS export ABC transporter periplasmic protein LptC [Candidatus Neomarinimicrobiota bacterium]MCF7840545.1 LPS export ABC transporter periplasmic protein LptC [Candidatus Neomarinimicrobiota bacterium]